MLLKASRDEQCACCHSQCWKSFHRHHFWDSRQLLIQEHLVLNEIPVESVPIRKFQIMQQPHLALISLLVLLWFHPSPCCAVAETRFDSLLLDVLLGIQQGNEDAVM